MIIKIAMLVFTIFWIVFWMTREKNIKTAYSAGRESNHQSKPNENGEELTDSQSAEVVSTWNLLNPP